MDWREFIASLLGSLAWPTAVVVLVWLLRDHVKDLLAAPLGRVKVGIAELNWDRGIEQVAVSTVRASAEVGPNRQAPPPLTADGQEQQDRLNAELDNLARLIEHSPSAAVQQAFALVERELQRFIAEPNRELPTGPNRHDVLIKMAFLAGVINRATGDALRGLVHLRDLAADDPSGLNVSPEKAREYLVLVRAVLYAFEFGPREASRDRR